MNHTKPNLQGAISNNKTGNPIKKQSALARVSNTRIRLRILSGIAFVALGILAVALFHLIKNPESDNTSMAILISSMSTIVVAIVGVMAGTSLDNDKEQ